MPKRYNRTKRTAKTTVNNSNTETVNIGRAPGINTASQMGFPNQQVNNIGEPENYMDPSYVGENFYNNVYSYNQNNYNNISETFGSDIWKIYQDMYSLDLNGPYSEYKEFIRRMRDTILMEEGNYHLTPSEQMYMRRLRDIESIAQELYYAKDHYEQDIRNLNGLSANEAIWAYNSLSLDLNLSSRNLTKFDYDLRTVTEPLYVNLEHNQLQSIPYLPDNLVRLDMDDNPLQEPFLSIYNQYKETEDLQRLIRRVNDAHESSKRIKAMENIFPQLPSNVIRHEIEPFLRAEGGRKKRKHKTKKRNSSKRISK